MKIGVIIFIAGVFAAVTPTAEGSSSLRAKVRELKKGLQNADDKIASSSKKMKKAIKKELRNNIFPKIRSFVDESMEEIARKGINRKIITLEEAIETLGKKLMNMEKRMKTAEEENILLKKSLKLSQIDCLTRMLQSNGCLSGESEDGPGVPEVITSTAGTVADVTSVVTEKIPENDTDGESVLTTLHPLFAVDGVTFNVSSSMPKIWNGVSIMVAGDEDLTRISLQKPNIRGSIKTDKFVESIAYDPVIKKLFWSCYRPHRKKSKYVFSAALDGSDLTLLLEGKRTFFLAVDGKEQLVFMSDWTSTIVSSMTTTGHNYKLVRGRFNTIGRPKTIVLDTDNHRLFVSFTSEIFSMSYDGSGLKKHAGGSWMKPMALDPTGGVLYFSDKKNLYRFDLESEKKVLVNQMNHDMNTLVFHDNKLYISYQKRNVSIDILSISDNTVRPFTFAKGDWYRMCLIQEP